MCGADVMTSCDLPVAIVRLTLIPVWHGIRISWVLSVIAMHVWCCVYNRMRVYTVRCAILYCTVGGAA